VKIRTFNVLRLLARDFDVTALCFYRRTMNRDVTSELRALSTLGRVEAFPIPQEHSRARLTRDHAASLLSGRVYTAFVYESRAFRAQLTELLQEQSFDLVHADSLDLAVYFPEVIARKLPLVCVHHDAQSLLLERRAAVERTRWRRAYIRHQSALMSREERTWCPRVTLNVTVSAADQAVLSGHAPGATFAVVPNGVDTRLFQPERRDESGILFVGGAGWKPNADAIAWYADEIAPALRAIGVSTPLDWVGRVGEAERARYMPESGVRPLGYVHDVRPHLAAAACFAVPIRIGGGTRIKILDAWAMGKAVVSTSIGCEGLDAIDGENILIRNEPRAFAEAVRDVLVRPALRHCLGAAARQTAVERYDWDVIGRAMSERYRALVPHS
jgi:glycosyltransferase involved in cell wall biosynthesis